MRRKKRTAIFIPVKPGSYRRLSPSELIARGLSPKSARYIGPGGKIISKRLYQESQLYERTGGRVTLAQRALNYARGIWTYLKNLVAPAKARKAQARKTRRDPIIVKEFKDRLRRIKWGRMSVSDWDEEREYETAYDIDEQWYADYSPEV